MIADTPVEQIAQYLEANGYTRVSLPLRISGLTFDVPAALIGSEKSMDLVLVVDTAFETGEQIARIVQSIGRAMDVARSRRPFTTVVAGPAPGPAVLEQMASVCRVLPIGRIDGGRAERAFENWLAVLTPLKIPIEEGRIADPISELKAALDEFDDNIARLAEIAPRGSAAVKRAVNEIIKQELQGVLDPEDD